MVGEDNSPATAAPTPQCQYFVQRKKRLCRMTVKPGRQYCGEHEPQPTTEAGQSDKRIPCPNDPKHTVYASKLMKHLAICNARQTEQPPYIQHNINAPEAVESCPRRPLSSIPKDEIAAVVDKVNRLYAKHVEGHITEEPSQPIHRTVLPEFSAAERTESSRRHLRQVSALLRSVERAGLARDRTCYVELGAGKGQLSYYACHAWCTGSSRVLAVDRAPLRHKRDNKLRSAPPAGRPAHDTTTNPAGNSTDTSDHHTDPMDPAKSNKDSRISEFMDTAGDSDNHNRTGTASGDSSNGTTSKRSIIDQHNSLSDTSNVIHSSDLNRIASLNNERDAIANDINDSSSERELLDDNSSDQKSVDSAKDILVAEDACVDEGAVAERLRADLAHVALAGVPAVARSAAVVGLAKHLCGAATDLALRCVAAAGVRHKTRGAVIAACCHHRVERALYVANTQLQELGIDAEDFNVMLGIVSWATCGDGRSRSRRAQAQQTQPEQTQPEQTQPEQTQPEQTHTRQRRRQEAAGRRAKALLDWGRVLWLRERGFDARLAYYVPKEVSLENTVIIASKP